MNVDFGPDFGPAPEPRDASEFFGTPRLFIAGSERVPIELVGTLRDGATPCSELSQVTFRAPEGDEISFSEVAVNIAAHSIHPRRGESLLNSALEVMRGERRASGKLVALLNGLRMLSQFFDVNFAIGREEERNAPYLAVMRTFVGTEAGVLPALFVQALSDTFEYIDRFLFRANRETLYASSLMEASTIEVQTEQARHSVVVHGFLSRLHVRSSVWKPGSVVVNVPAEAIDSQHGVAKLRMLQEDGLVHDRNLAGVFDELPLRAEEAVDLRICGAWKSKGYERAYARLQLRLRVGNLIEERAILKGALHLFLRYCDLNLGAELARRELEEQRMILQKTPLETLSFDDVVRRRILESGLYRPARLYLKPGVPYFEETLTAAMIRIEPVDLHPAIDSFDARELLIEELSRTRTAELGGLVINFVQDTVVAARYPRSRPGEQTQSFSKEIYYWQIASSFDPETRAFRLAALDSFLATYYLTLRTGIRPGELEGI